MNPIKSTHELLLEKAGLAPATPGMVNSGQQMLLDETGVMPQFADGGSVGSILAQLFAMQPQQFQEGGQPAPQGDQMHGILSRLAEVLSSSNQN